MNITNQVCTQGQAKRLKELGVCQDSIFSYFKAPHHAGICNTDMSTRHVWILSGNPYDAEDIELTAAFTVAELGAMLPEAYELSNSGMTNVMERFGRDTMMTLIGAHPIFNMKQKHNAAQLCLFIAWRPIVFLLSLLTSAFNPHNNGRKPQPRRAQKSANHKGAKP